MSNVSQIIAKVKAVSNEEIEVISLREKFTRVTTGGTSHWTDFYFDTEDNLREVKKTSN
tara:strand:+ start:398 stop:574 length:177 start_codon:yes stop_codon:yes gene_type:complete